MVNEKKFWWKYFKVIDVPNSKTKKVDCKFCYKQYTANATRMYQHISETCVKCPIDIRQKVKTQGLSNKTVSFANSGHVPSCYSTAPTSSIAEEPPDEADNQVHVEKSPKSHEDESTSSTNNFIMSQTPQSESKSVLVPKRKKQPTFGRIERFCDSISPEDQVLLNDY